MSGESVRLVNSVTLQNVITLGRIQSHKKDYDVSEDAWATVNVGWFIAQYGAGHQLGEFIIWDFEQAGSEIFYEAILIS